MRHLSRTMTAWLVLACSVACWCILGAGLPRAATADETPRWRLPLARSPQVLRRFDAPDTPWGTGHRGVDLAARPGQAVYAAGAGRVGYAGMVAGRGVVTVVHGALRTTYLPVDAAVRAGRRVSAGERLGVVEHRATHCRPDSCLHWGLIRGAEYLDPLSLVGAGRVRLLPFWGTPAPPAPGSGGSRGPPRSDHRETGHGSPAAVAPRAAPPGSEPRPRHVPLSLAGSSTAVGGGAAGMTALAFILVLTRRRLRRTAPTNRDDRPRPRHGAARPPPE